MHTFFYPMPYLVIFPERIILSYRPKFRKIRTPNIAVNVLNLNNVDYSLEEEGCDL